MGKRLLSQTVTVVLVPLKPALSITLFLGRNSLKLFTAVAKKLWRLIGLKKIHAIAKHHHGRTVGRLHNHLLGRWHWYGKWHRHPYHQHVHYSVIVLFLLAVGVYGFYFHGTSLAATRSWDFSTASDYTFDNSKIEVSGGLASLKAAGTPGSDWIAAGGGNNWAYRTPITLTNSSGTAYTDYQMEFNEQLVGNWKFDDTPSSATDSSGNGYSGSASGTLVAGKFGNATSLNGSSNFAFISDNSALTPSTLTWSVWVNPSSLPTSGNRMGIIDKRDDDGAGTGYLLELFNNGGTQQVVWRTGASSLAVNTTLATDTWSHIVVTQTSTTATLYINGSQAGTGAQTAPTNYAFQLYFGKERTNSFFAGKLDEIRLYSRELNTDEISDLYNANIAGRLADIYAHAQESGADIRFTDSDGKTQIDYWIKQFTANGQNGHLWVNIPSIGASSSKTIYAYYSNSAAAGVSSFDQTFVQPSSVSGNALWLKADAITGLSDGAAVSSWSDSSGNGHNVSQSTPANQPTYHAGAINGKPAIKFDASSEVLTNGTLLGAGNFPTNQATEFVVFRLTTGNVSYSVLATGSAGNELWRFSGTGSGYFGEFRNTRIETYPAATPSSGDHLTVVRSGTGAGAYEVWQDGVSAGAQNPSWGIGSTFQVGANAASALGVTGGEIPEVIIYNTDLSANDRLNVSRYLAVKYALSWADPVASDVSSSFGTAVSLYATDSPTITAVSAQGYQSVSSFTEALGAGSSGGATYQLSPNNGTNWYWWDGAGWSAASGQAQSNSGTVVNTNISTFTAGSSPKQFLWRAFLNSNGGQDPIIDSVVLEFVWDSVAPPNPSSVSGFSDNTAATPITSGAWNKYPTPHFSWAAPADIAGAGESPTGIDGYYVYYGTDQSADPFTAGVFQTTTSYTVNSMTNGSTYYLRFKTKDLAGNISAAQTLFTYKYDNDLPTIPEYVNLSPVGCSTSSLFHFSWPASSDPTSGVAGYEYRLGSTGTIQSSAALEIDVPPYQSGDNIFYVRAKDQAGNVSSFQTSIYCATEVISIVDGPTVEAGPSSLSVKWTSSKPTTSFVRILDGNDYVSEQGQSGLTQAHDVKVVGLEPEKSYKYKLIWTDSAGNVGESPLFSTSTSAAPNVKNFSASILSPTSALVSWQTTELSSVVVEYGIGSYSTQKTLSGVATNFTQQLTGLQAGSNYQIRVSARTQDGYPYFYSVNLQTPPLPKISDLRFDYMPGAQAAVRVTWQTNVPSTSLVRYSTGGDTKTQSSAELVTDHSVVVDGLLDNSAYEFTAQSTDQYGNIGVSDKQTYSTPFDTRPPKISNLNVEIKSSGVGSGQKAQIVVSWETDEPATGQIEYGPGISNSSYPSKSQEDKALATSHVIIVSQLEPSKLYHLRAVSRDRSGNVGASIDTTAITGKVQKSVVDLIINSLERSLTFLTRLPLIGR